MKIGNKKTPCLFLASGAAKMLLDANCVVRKSTLYGLQ